MTLQNVCCHLMEGSVFFWSEFAECNSGVWSKTGHRLHNADKRLFAPSLHVLGRKFLANKASPATGNWSCEGRAPGLRPVLPLLSLCFIRHTLIFALHFSNICAFWKKFCCFNEHCRYFCFCYILGAKTHTILPQFDAVQYHFFFCRIDVWSGEQTINHQPTACHPLPIFTWT